MLEEFLKAFFSIFVIMDVLGNVPLFWMLSQKMQRSQKIHSVNRAVLVAGILLLIFLVFGESILKFFGITLNSFRIAGGLIILIIALRMVSGKLGNEKHYDKYEFATVPLATPLITGPGVITTIILLTQQVGFLITLAASLCNLAITWLGLHYSENLYKIMGRQGAEVLSRVMGLILTAIAIEFIMTGWKAMI